MKTTKLLTLAILSVFFAGCNSDNDDIDGIPNHQIKLIKTVSDGVESAYYYENGKIIKGVGNSTPNHSNYHSSFQVEYDGSRVKRVFYSNGISYPKPADFNFNYDINTPNIIQYYYNYSGDKLISISYGPGGPNYWEFLYDNQGRISESINYIFGNGSSYRGYKYSYDSSGKVITYIRTETYVTPFTASGTITLDDKINPHYILWDKFNFIYPQETSGLSNMILPFFKNNIIDMTEENNVHYKASFNYDGEYPNFYKQIIPSTSSSVLKSIEYLD